MAAPAVSCPVDADFLDTEAYMDPDKSVLRAGYPSIHDLLAHFTTHMERLHAEAQHTPVNAIRDRVLA